ncbi:fimbria/pilus outer membrane usher protein [Citrobacter werkmanii]|uniref:fimbria/pilus outer membrane usher protein n=1 Tax=Citrobacter werkmanii TaxID=67827 RepID=UPI0037C90500
MKKNHSLILLAFLIHLFLQDAKATDYKFSADELENTSQTSVKDIDVEQFNKNSQYAGEYYVLIILNGKRYNKIKIKFISDSYGKLQPRLTAKQISFFGLKPVIDEKTYQKYQSDTSDEMDMKLLFPGSTSDFNFSKLQLSINIPQIYLVCQDKCDYSIPPQQWDEGINALLLNYDVSGSEVKNELSNFHSGDQFLKLNSGVNLGAWRLRTQLTFDQPEEGRGTWNSNDTWIQRDIPNLASSFYAGDRSSSAVLFDGFPYHGVSLATSNNMLSDKAHGYAPTIRGMARTANARVQVSQNGNVIYQTYVPAGAFEIRDLYPQSEGGEFKVSIKETDGSEHSFTQGWGSVPVMQRPGYLKYSFETGRYNNTEQPDHPFFGQMGLFYGLPGAMTVYGGIQTAQGYSAVDPGFAFGIGSLGAVSADISIINNHVDPENRSHGKSYRFQYSSVIPSMRTDFSLSWAISPDKGYTSFSNTMENLHSDLPKFSSQKNKLQTTINQPLSNGGAVSINFWRTEYRNQPQEKNFNLNYTQNWDEMTFSMAWSWTQETNGTPDQQLICSVQIPLSLFENNIWMNTGISARRPGTPTQTFALNGDNNIGYNPLTWEAGVTTGHSDDRSISANAEYKNSHGDYQGGYSKTSTNQNYSWRAQGSFIATSYGISAGQPFDTGNAVALVRANRAPDLKIANNPGVTTDRNGLAIVPYLQPYRDDAVSVDTSGISYDTTLDNTELHLVPTEGAVALATFTPYTGRKILVTLHRPDGSLVPYGATATAGARSNEGIVDDRGQVFIAGANDDGRINVVWGDAKKICHSSYHLHPEQSKHLYELSLICI